MVKSSDEAVVLVFNGCDEAVVKYFCVVTVIVSVRACVCVDLVDCLVDLGCVGS